MADLSELQRCAKLAPCSPIMGGVAYRFVDKWTPETTERLLKDATGQVPPANFIRLHSEGLRSNQAVALSLHQEDYHLEVRPKLLALLCLENEAEGGETLVAAVDPALVPEELRDADVRFFRHSVGEWTPWRPVLQLQQGKLWPRIALPDVHRSVDVSTGREALTAWGTRLDASAVPVSWVAGTLLIIDNRSAIHGRRALAGATRSLMRWVL